jgi:hypothetical protein
MAKADPGERIKAIETQLEQLKARRAKLLAQQRAAEAKAKRGADTRRKILVGALVLSKLDDPELGARFRAFLQRELGTFLSREDDRALFPDLLATQDRPADPDLGRSA